MSCRVSKVKQRYTPPSIRLVVPCFSLLLASGVSGLADDGNAPPTPLALTTNHSDKAVPTQVLTPEEADQALKRLSNASPGTGTWRCITVTFSSNPPPTNDWPAWLRAGSNVTWGWPASSNVTYEWRSSDGKIRERERITEQDESGKLEYHLYVKNERGRWKLFDGTAILLPTPTKGSAKAYGKLARTFDGIAGERFNEGERMYLRITQWMTEDGFQERLKAARKDIPLLLRPIFSDSFLERGASEMLPWCVETIIDQETGNLITRRSFRKDGKLSDLTEGWTPVDALPPESYIVPENSKKLTPKSSKEAQQLERKIRAAEARTAEGKLKIK